MALDGLLVGAEPLVSRLAEQPVLGPFGEGDLGDQLGFDPVDGLAERRLAFIEGIGPPWPSESNRLRRSSRTSRVYPVPTLPA